MEGIVDRRRKAVSRQPRRRSRDTALVIFNLAVNRFKIFTFATGPFLEQGHLHPLNTYTSLRFPSGPISTLGGTRKVVKRNIWGGMYKFIMSVRVDGLYNDLGEGMRNVFIHLTYLQLSRLYII